MLTADSLVYRSGEAGGGFTGYVGGERFFCTLEIGDGYEVERGDELLRELSQLFAQNTVSRIHELENLLAGHIKKANLPLNFSFCAGYLNGEIFLLKTFGGGAVLLKRGRQFAQIISGDQSATGYVRRDDVFLFCSRTLLDKMGEVVNDLQLEQDKMPIHTIALFVSFKEPGGGEKRDWNKIFQPIRDRWDSYRGQIGKRKIFTFIAVAVIAVIFLWSVVLGYQRRRTAEEERKIRSAKEFIMGKLDQADEVSFVSLSRAQILVGEAKEELLKLKTIQKIERNKEYQELAKLIEEKENKIIKKEEKSYEEFFDLTTDEKNAQGKKIALDGENVAILDADQGASYLLSLTKKSFDKLSSAQIKGGGLIALYENSLFVYKRGEGIYKSGVNQGWKKIITKDDEWGDIADMAVYNGNIYLLDRGKEQIYKYVSATGGYSDKTSYFKAGEGADLAGSHTMAIDSSVYISFADFIIKYTTGARDAFTTTYPDDQVAIAKVLTNKDLERVYIWNKQSGSLYILGKNGSYEKQIQSSIFKKGDDVVVFSGSAYVLQGAKIYKVNLE